MRTCGDVILDLAEEVCDELDKRKVKTREEAENIMEELKNDYIVEAENAFDVMLEDYCDERDLD